jgi:hypothetical protein
MECKVNCLKTTFSDFYGSGYSNVNHFTGPEYTISPQTPTSNYVYVHDCVFRSCTSSSHGGALYCHSSNNVIKLLVGRTSFTSCRTSKEYGGAIHFDSQTNGECILNKICGFDCLSTYSSSNSYGQFAYIRPKSDVTFKNRVNDSSFTHSSKVGTYSCYVLWLYYGSILCPSVNITNNECHHCTAIYCYPTASSTSDTCCISYSSIVNNTANGSWLCIAFSSNSVSSHLMDTCNVLNNKQTSYSYGIIWANANLLIKDSCILGNDKDKNIFYEDHSSCKITISNCTIDDDIFTNGRYYGSVAVNKVIENSFINALSHIATRNCDSYFDSYGTLTAKPIDPSRCLRCLMSCVCKHPMIDSLLKFQLMFLLTMLPSDPAKDNYFEFNFVF